MNKTISGLPRLSGDFVRGYTKAIQDMENAFICVNQDLIHHKMRLNYDWAMKILHCFLMNREKFRENRNGFLRTELSDKGKREVIRYYEPKQEEAYE